MVKCTLCRSLLAALGCGLLLLVTPAVSVAKKVQKPTDRVRSIAASAAGAGGPPLSGRIPYLPAELGNAGQEGASPSTPTAPSAAAGPPPSTLLNRAGARDGRLTPPDSTGAIGPSHYVEIVNSTISVYDRADLTLVSQAEADTQFTQGQFFDPQVEWDPVAQRWFYSAVGPNIGFNHSLAFGWTKTSDPADVDSTDATSGWCHYVLETSTLDDYPKLGHSDGYLLIGTNMFVTSLGSSATYKGSRVWAIPKPGPGTTCPSPPVASSFGDPDRPLLTQDGHWASTPVPTNTIDATPDGYVVAADNPNIVNEGGSASQIMVWHVRKASTGPELVQDGNIDVPPFRPPPDVPMPGTQGVLANQGEGRLTNAIMEADPNAGGTRAIWTQHAVEGPGGRSDVRWYELLPATRTVRQQGSIGSEDHTLNAAISPTKNGVGAAIFYTVSSSRQMPEIRGRARAGSTPLGQLSDEVVLGTSSGVPNCEGRCRWGDYSGASPDPDNADAVWGTNALTAAPDEYQWTTRNFAVSVRSLSRLATVEDGAFLHPTTGFDWGSGVWEIKGPGDYPGPYEGDKYLRLIYYPKTGNAEGWFTRYLVNGSDLWYGAALYLDPGFERYRDYLTFLKWWDPGSDVHGGVSLRADDRFDVVRGRTPYSDDDVNVGPSFSLPEGRWFWLEVHQRLNRADPLTEVFVNGHLVSTSAALDNYPDSAGVPSRLSFGVGSRIPFEEKFSQVYVDRASMSVRQRGAVSAPATPSGFTGSGQDRTAILFWNAVPRAVGYRVYRQASDGTWAQRFDTRNTGTFDAGLTNCFTYAYRVTSYDSAGLESNVSGSLAITPSAPGQDC